MACGHSATGEDVLTTVDGGTRIHLRHTPDPRSGFYVAPVGPGPKTGDGFDAPRPEAVYAHAPDLLREAAEVMRIGTELSVRAAAIASTMEHPVGEIVDAFTDGIDVDRARAYLLRRAALADRHAIEWPAEEPILRDAVDTSQDLIRLDRRHREFAPPGPPDPAPPSGTPPHARTSAPATRQGGGPDALRIRQAPAGAAGLRSICAPLPTSPSAPLAIPRRFNQFTQTQSGGTWRSASRS